MKWPFYIVRFLLLALNLHLPLGRKLDEQTTVEITRELGYRKERRKRVHKTYPVKRKKLVKERIERRFKSTSPKDHRFSNQRRLRRMYRNS